MFATSRTVVLLSLGAPPSENIVAACSRAVDGRGGAIVSGSDSLQEGFRAPPSANAIRGDLSATLSERRPACFVVSWEAPQTMARIAGSPATKWNDVESPRTFGCSSPLLRPLRPLLFRWTPFDARGLERLPVRLGLIFRLPKLSFSLPFQFGIHRYVCAE